MTDHPTPATSRLTVAILIVAGIAIVTTIAVIARAVIDMPVRVDAARSEAAPAASPPPPAAEPPTTSGPSADAPIELPPPTIEVRTPVEPGRWIEIASALPALTLPSDCPLPIGDAAHLPNSSRAYRGGVHQGIDFICEERGRIAAAALPGRVVQVNSTYVEPAPAERAALLDDAQAIGETPAWTLALLYGRYVVLDHGVLPDVGHTVSIYAHLDDVTPDLTPGRYVEAGTPLGEIGNRGTDPAVSGVDDPRSIHLHWELIIDGAYLGAGLGSSATSQLYADVFGI